MASTHAGRRAAQVVGPLVGALFASSAIASAPVRALPEPSTGTEVEIVRPAGVGGSVAVNTRVLDTRTDGEVVAAMAEVRLDLGALRSQDRHVILNVTVAQPSQTGHAEAYPCAEEPPDISHVNFGRHENVANLVVVEADRGPVCLVSSASTHLIVDHISTLNDRSGWSTTDDDRVVDTRRELGFGRVNADSYVELSALIPQDAESSAVLNIVALRAANSGFVSVGRCGGDGPFGEQQTSSINVVAERPRANLAIVQRDSCVYSSVDVDLVIDLVGSVTQSVGNLDGEPQLQASNTVGPRGYRSIDTRLGQRVEASTERRLGLNIESGDIGGRGHPVVELLNVTVVNPSSDGHLTIYDCAVGPGDTSTVNYRRGETIAHLSAIPNRPSGELCAVSTADTDLAIDRAGLVLVEAPLGFGVGVCIPQYSPEGEGVESARRYIVDGEPFDLLLPIPAPSFHVYDGEGPYRVRLDADPLINARVSVENGDHSWAALRTDLLDAPVGRYTIDITVTDSAGATAIGSVTVERQADMVLMVKQAERSPFSC